MTPEKLDAVRANIFYAAHPAIEPADSFWWHLGRDKVCDTDRPHSSQALAKDYFGTLKAADQLSRDIILAEIASEIGLPFKSYQELLRIAIASKPPNASMMAQLAKWVTEKNVRACCAPLLPSASER